ncbi:hypothetical protein H5410_008409 [Solanum commersonii]|uniref:Uncharacterized protein n=1 Tax=Solanum commersonii TaxID=4109 RepID=A0A9J6AGP8_SOLCO|nr:hypothetical protein H5410_008409 [Solanum commersonii]
MVSSTRSGNNASIEKRSSKDKNNNKFGSDEENTCSSKLNHVVNDFASSAFLSDLTPPASETVITEIFPLRLTVDPHIHRAQLHPLLISNNDESTEDQTPKAKLEKVLEEKSTKEVVVATKQQKEAQVNESIEVMAKRLRHVFGDIPRTYTPRKRLCDVFGDGSDTSRPIRTVNDAYNKKHHVPTEKDTHPRQSLNPPIRLTVDLPISSPMATTTQEREIVVDAAVIPVEGVGDNVAEEQQAPEPLNASAELCSAIHHDLIPMVKNHCTNLNILPPGKDDKEYY